MVLKVLSFSHGEGVQIIFLVLICIFPSSSYLSTVGNQNYRCGHILNLENLIMFIFHLRFNNLQCGTCVFPNPAYWAHIITELTKIFFSLISWFKCQQVCMWTCRVEADVDLMCICLHLVQLTTFIIYLISFIHQL